MNEFVTTLPVKLRPDSARTVLRPFSIEDAAGFLVENHPRLIRIVDRVLQLDNKSLLAELEIVMKPLKARHRDLEGFLLQRFEELDGLALKRADIDHQQRLLIGAYFSEEFSFESAALFNPSIVRHPDQPGVEAGALRFVLSLRGIGEGHISSLTFRTGTWESNGDVTVNEPSAYAVGPSFERSQGGQGQLIVQLGCGCAEDISETVIYPFMPSQGRGIEDARLVEFTEDDGAKDFRGTYTAFNGTEVRQGLLRTSDFKTFEMRGVQGSMYSGKGMALFPRRIDGLYFMLGRQDNENIWLLSSDDPHTWNGGDKIIEPQSPWEFVQIGNCGSPIEIDEGWLVLTHGVGAARNYCMGACLLDKRDPSKVVAKLTRPFLRPDDNQRDGYVPNVIYSCGALLRDRIILLPYGEADNFAAFAKIDLDGLLSAMA
jgi:predicted GH43/DUF377 family glycosyl hydrolase